MKNGGMSMNKFLEELRKMLPEYNISECGEFFLVFNDKKMLEFTFKETDKSPSVVAGKIRFAFEHLMDPKDEAIFFAPYEAIKDRLFIKAIPLGRAAGGVYHEIGDIALTVYLRLNPENGNLRSVMVNNGKYQVDKELIWQQAMSNTQNDKPVAYDFFGLLFGEGAVDLNSVEYDTYNPPFISTENKLNGAVAMFYPGVAEKLRDIVGEDYYIVFTSVHEFCVHPKWMFDLKELKDILSGTIKEATPEDEILTREIYEYSEGKIHLCK